MPSANSAQDEDDTQTNQTQSVGVAASPGHGVAHQITDAVAMTNVMTIGIGPSYSALQAMLGQTQSQNVLMANMVSSQKQNSMVGMTAMTKSIQQLMNRRNS